jgi:hypothetical protein
MASARTQMSAPGFSVRVVWRKGAAVVAKFADEGATFCSGAGRALTSRRGRKFGGGLRGEGREQRGGGDWLRRTGRFHGAAAETSDLDPWQEIRGTATFRHWVRDRLGWVVMGRREQSAIFVGAARGCFASLNRTAEGSAYEILTALRLIRA